MENFVQNEKQWTNRINWNTMREIIMFVGIDGNILFIPELFFFSYRWIYIFICIIGCNFDEKAIKTHDLNKWIFVRFVLQELFQCNFKYKKKFLLRSNTSSSELTRRKIALKIRINVSFSFIHHRIHGHNTSRNK